MANKSKKQQVTNNLVGTATFCLLAYQVLFFIMFVSVASTTVNHTTFTVLLVGNAVAIIGGLALLIVYIKHATANKRLTDGQKVGWVIAFLFLNILAMMVYWYRYLLYRSVLVK